MTGTGSETGTVTKTETELHDMSIVACIVCKQQTANSNKVACKLATRKTHFITLATFWPYSVVCSSSSSTGL